MLLLHNLAEPWRLPLTAATTAEFLLLLLALCVTGQATVGFAAVVLLQFFCVLPVTWLPAGLSSLVRLNLSQTGGAVSVLSAAALLAAVF